jgi:hypothetical protein
MMDLRCAFAAAVDDTIDLPLAAVDDAIDLVVVAAAVAVVN